MKDPKTLQEKLGESLQTNKFAIFLEIVVVFLPLYLGLAISDRLGIDQIPLGGDVVIKGGPILSLGMIISLVFLWLASRLRGVSWDYFGMTRPKSWFRTVLKSLGVALAVGTPPLLAALALGYFSNLFSSMTHYGTGPAPVLFGSGYVEISDWWKLGLVVSIVNIAIWILIGGAWWRLLGFWPLPS